MKLASGSALDFTLWLVELVQPLRVMLYMMLPPVPALAGVKVLPDTPGPQTVPPAVVGVRVTADASAQ